jgi:hypothetical protein
MQSIAAEMGSAIEVYSSIPMMDDDEAWPGEASGFGPSGSTAE